MNSRLAEALRISEEAPGSTSSRRSCVGAPALGRLPDSTVAEPRRGFLCTSRAQAPLHLRSEGEPGSTPHPQQLHPSWETSQAFAFSSFYFYTFFCIKKKSIITTNYKRLKQD